MTYDEITSAVVQWVAAASGLPIYRAGQDFNAPSTDYGTVELSLIDDTHDNHDKQSWDVDDDSATITRRFEEELVYSVNVFASEPLALMSKVKANARAAESYQIEGGPLIHESGPIASLRELENSQYADRAQMNLTVRAHITETKETEVIEEVLPVVGQTFD